MSLLLITMEHWSITHRVTAIHFLYQGKSVKTTYCKGDFVLLSILQGMTVL